MRNAFRSLRTNHCSPSKPALGSRSFADWLVGNPAPHGLERFSDERERSLAFRSKGRASPRTSRRRERRIRPTEVAESIPWWARLSTRRSAHRRGSERALTASFSPWRTPADRPLNSPATIDRTTSSCPYPLITSSAKSWSGPFRAVVFPTQPYDRSVCRRIEGHLSISIHRYKSRLRLRKKFLVIHPAGLRK